MRRSWVSKISKKTREPTVSFSAVLMRQLGTSRRGRIRFRRSARESIPTRMFELVKVIDLANAGQDAIENGLVQAKQVAPWSRRLALAQYSAAATPFATERPQSAGNAGAMQSRIREFDPRGDFNSRRACDYFRIRRSPVAIRLLAAAEFSLCDRLHATDEELHAFVLALDSLIAGGELATDTLSIAEFDDVSGSARIAFPGGGLETWLGWQVPEYDLRIICSEQAGDRTLDQMGISDGPLPILINPFRLAPRIEGAHVLINLDEVLAALTMASPKDALLSAVVHKLALSTLVPWGNNVAPEEKAFHLARLIGSTPDEVTRRLPPEALAPMLKRLLDRLRLELTLEPRTLFEGGDIRRKAANHCLAFMSGGHIFDAFDIIWRTRLRRQGGPSILPANSFLSGQHAEAEFRQQATNNFVRWQARQEDEEKLSILGYVAPRACVEIWTAQPQTASQDEVVQHLHERLEFTDKSTPMLLCRWMIEETILLGGEDGRLQPNPAHPFSSIRL